MSSAVPGSAAARDGEAQQHAIRPTAGREGLAAQPSGTVRTSEVDDGACRAGEREEHLPSVSADDDEPARAGAKRPAARMTGHDDSGQAGDEAWSSDGHALAHAPEKRARVAAADITAPVIMVKIGAAGLYGDVDLPVDGLQRMRRMALLRALKAEDAFAVKLKDVALDECTVWLLPRVAGDEPTAVEEAAAVELRAATTIGELLSAQRWTPSRLLFLRVQTPPAPAVLLAAGVPAWMPPAADDAAPRVVSAIRSGKYEITVDGHINLTQPGVTWPDLDSPMLFVRSFYNDMYEHVLQGCSTPEMLYQVTGQPGIGKSAFGLYVLFQAVKAGRSVVYASHKGKFCFEFPAGPSTSVSVLRCMVTDYKVEAMSRLMQDRHALCILDGCKLQARKCATLQVSSPRLLRTIAPKEDTNSNSMTLTMPAYTHAELMQLRQVAFNKKVTEEDALYRMSFWGPIPRHVLAWSAAEQQARVERIRTADVAVIMRQERADVASEEVSHSVFIKCCKGQFEADGTDAADGSDSDGAEHSSSTSSTPLTSDEHDYYLPGPIVWASTPIMNFVFRRATAVQVAELCANIRIAQVASRSIMTATNGDMFESLATILLHWGGDFRLTKAAVPRSRATFSSLPSEVIHVQSSSPELTFGSADDLKVQVEACKGISSFVLHARNRKECAVDGIIKLNDGRFILYKTTFAKRHSIMSSTTDGKGGIIPIAKALGLLRRDGAGEWTCDTIYFAFLIPLNEPPCIKNEQKVLDGKPSDTASAAESALVRESLQQHVVILPEQLVWLREAGVGVAPLAPVAATGQYAAAVKSLEEFSAELHRLQLKSRPVAAASSARLT